MAAIESQDYTPKFLQTKQPVLLPVHEALRYERQQFEAFLKQDVKPLHNKKIGASTADDVVSDDDATLVSKPTASSTGEVRQALDEMDIQSIPEKDADNEHPFMKALHSTNDTPDRDMTGIMRTENQDLAHRTTSEPLVDLFFELEDVVSGPQLRTLLDAAWKADALATLKIIFNARSIHLGKSSRTVAYRCFGWLAENHPLTLLTNLQWLSRPVIEKKVGEKQKAEQEEDMVLIEPEKSADKPASFDVQNGVAHGYWKDLLNILALTVEGKLDPLANPKDQLNITDHGKKSEREWDVEKAKAKRHAARNDRHENAIKALQENAFYRDLHLVVARLFVEQLETDLKLLRSEDKKNLRQISLCAKWAPSAGGFHDKHTFIVSSIAELLHPQSEFPNISDREVYLRYARENYRKDVSALRKALEVVERDIAANKFENIHYDRVPSLAMNRYSNLFAKKDEARFDKYIDKVAEGKKSISGATLLPSTLISKVRSTNSRYWMPPASTPKKGTKGMVEAKLKNIDAKVLDGQWNTLVKRIKDSGKLENSIAVADVSGSMMSPQFADGSCPLDSSIGLALLLAEITAPPFGGSFITFSAKPKMQKVQGATLQEKVSNLESAHWEMSTNVVAVFDQLILPLAIKHKVKQEDMVKQTFIFSDMQFNSAAQDSDKWTTSYERIKSKFKDAGYDMPQLVFWNLAGGRAGVTNFGDPTAPKPVTAHEEGTALVSGYSQGMLKVFLDNGAFKDPEAEEEIIEEVKQGDDGEEIVVTKKQKKDPMSTVRKALSHEAYSMLKVVD